ncbi:MAG: molybdopterin-guanine dinucleotide biosynthesis protein MobB [Gammaproteobacteria bacterium]
MATNTHPFTLPLLGFVAFSGTGKTTLLKQLIPLLKAQGLRLALIKHTHHTFDVDTPGKDSYELRQAGAEQVIVASRRRWALMVETPQQTGDPRLEVLLPHLNSDALDLVLVEGFKHAAIPKIELHRPALNHPLLFPADTNIIAIASDAPLAVKTHLPMLDLNNPAAIVGFIMEFVDSCKS